MRREGVAEAFAVCETFRMSEQPVTAAGLPKWDLADRMRKSLRHAELGVAEMATYLDVDRSSVSNWLGGRVDPSTQTMRLWALRTGIPLAWFCHGSAEPCDIAPAPAKTAGQRSSGAYANKMQSSQTQIAS